MHTFRPQNRSRAAFSLTEIMVVLAIMAIMTSFALPSFVGLISSRGLAASGDLVVDLANQARQNSIAHNAMTALVLVRNSGNANWDNRLFIILQMTAANTGTTPSWTPVTKWEMLPPNTVVDPNQSATFVSQLPTVSPAPPTLTYLGTPVSTSAVCYQIFLPTGGLLLPTGTTPTPPLLHLVNGVSNGSGVTSRGSANEFYEVTINPYTGLTKVYRP